MLQYLDLIGVILCFIVALLFLIKKLFYKSDNGCASGCGSCASNSCEKQENSTKIVKFYK